MENKPKMILEMDEYERLLSGSKKESEMAICLMKFLSKCMGYRGEPLLIKLQDLMTESGYTIKYSGNSGDVKFGDGHRTISINQSGEVSNGEM